MSGLDDLFATIRSRRGADPDTSWTARLFAKGPEKCAEKFGEEAIEAVIEAVRGDRARLTGEAADVLYHLMVMLAARDVGLADVLAELDRRAGTSGIDEKARRGKAPVSPTTPLAPVTPVTPAPPVAPAIGAAGPGDGAAIAALYRAALPGEDLGPLLDDLAGFGGGVMSLVARQGSALVGHCAFTICGLGAQGGSAALLGPLAVTPDRQRGGIGRALVAAGTQRLQRAGLARVFVLGDPAYYGRLGFAPERRVAVPYPVPAEWADAWQSRRLREEPGDASADADDGPLTLPAPWRRAALWAP